MLAGACYLITVATSIPALALKRPLLQQPQLLDSEAGRAQLLAAVLLELVLAVSCVGTAVALFPVLRRTQETLALGFVCARTLEAAAIGTGAIALLTLAELAPGNPDDATVAMLVAIHDWTFLIGPGLIPALNALLLGTALLRTGLVPRIIPAIGVLGAPLLAASAIATILGRLDQVSTVAAVAALPVAIWEISLGFWLLLKGFRTAPGTGGNVAAAVVRTLPAESEHHDLNNRSRQEHHAATQTPSHPLPGS